MVSAPCGCSPGIPDPPSSAVLSSLQGSRQTSGNTPAGGTQQNARLANLTLDDLRRLLGQMNGPVTVEATDEEEEDDDGDDEYYFGYNTEPHWDRSKVFPEVKEPKEKGLELLTSGEFGRLEHQLKSRIRDNNTASILLNRGARQRPTHKEDLTSVSSCLAGTLYSLTVC